MEFEAYIFEPDGDGGWRPHRHARRLRLRHRTVGRPPRSASTPSGRPADGAEIPLESVNSEYDTPQFEFTLALQRRAASGRRRVPLQGPRARSRPAHGSAAHFHGQATEAIVADRVCTSTSPFKTDVCDERPSTTTREEKRNLGAGQARRSADLLQHHRALAGICAPNVNAYKRLRPASLSGYWAKLGI